MATLQELKKLACEAIEKNRDKIIELGDSIFEEPELGYKEYKTATKIKKIFDELNFEYEDEVALTGVIAPLKGRESKVKISVMGELDAVVAPEHRCADPKTGAAHSCGHNAMIASLAGVAYAFGQTDIMKELDGDVVLMAVPAEEYVEIEYRQGLREQGKIHFLGGKQELIRLGYMDDIDIMVMQHAASKDDAPGVLASPGPDGSNGFLGKLIRYVGKEAHSGGAPHKGINALNAATLGLTAIHMQRETFQDCDRIRVHPIVTKGGDLVNVVPADVRIETYVRGAGVEAILDANAKVSRALKAGGDAVGAQTEIIDIPGYLPILPNKELYDIMFENMKEIFGEDKVVYMTPPMGGSTDAGDVAHILPMIHCNFMGATGIGHSKHYEMPDKQTAYVDAAKCLAMTVIDLLYNGAEKALDTKAKFVPKFTKEEYLKEWGKL